MHVIKYLAVGLFIWFIGAIFLGSSSGFIARSEPAQLVVVGLDTKRNSDGHTMYRPVLALEAAKSSRNAYAGNHWTRPAPHTVGDVVEGRYDSESGEMRTDKMIHKFGWAGWIAKIAGILIGLQAFALILGVPESRLPLPVRVRSRRKRSRFVL